MAIKRSKKTASTSCAAKLGRKGGKAAVAKKAGIHSPAYKAKVKAKAKAKAKPKAKAKAKPKAKRKTATRKQASLF